MSDEVDQKEVKAALGEMGQAWEEFKRTNDAQLAEVKKSGTVLAEHTEKLTKIEKVIADAEAKHAQLVLALNRKNHGGEGASEQDSAEIKEYKSAFRKYICKGVEIPAGLETKALSVGSDPDGGFLVTPDMSGRMAKRIFETSAVRGLANVQTISTDALEGLYDNDEGTSGWVAEVGSRAATATPQLGQWRIPVHEMYANPAATQRLLDDAAFNVESWLADKVADKMGRNENLAFVLGTGIGQPKGFMTYAAGTAHKQIEQIVSGTSAVITADGLFNLLFALKMPYRGRAVWGFSRLGYAAIRKIKDSQNRYLWEPSLQLGTPSSLLGQQMAEMNDLAAIGASSLSGVIADWKEAYQIVDRQGVRVLRDPFTNKPYVQFYTTKRTGGDVVNFEAIKILKLST